MTDNLPERASIVANKNLVQLDIEQMQRFAIGYARAGVFQGKEYNSVASMEDLFVRISAGQAIGLDPFTSVSEMYFVKGKLTMSTNLQLALAKASGKYDYRVEWGDSLQEVGVTADDLARESVSAQEAASWPKPRWCRITAYATPEREIIGTSLWTLLDSKRAGLLAPSRNGEPSNHLKYPRAMLFNRAGSSAIAYYMPDATMIRAYDHGEVEGDVWEQRGPSTVTAEVVTEAPAPADGSYTGGQAGSEAYPEEDIQDADVEEVPQPPVPREGDDPDAPIFHEAEGEMRPGESPAEAMKRMVEEEAKDFDPATEPPPAVVPPINPMEPPSPEAAQFVQEMVDDGLLAGVETQPTVEVEEQEPIINPGRRGLVYALAGKAGLTDTRRREVLEEVAGTGHVDRIPDRLFQVVIDRLNSEAELAEQELGMLGQSDA